MKIISIAGVFALLVFVSAVRIFFYYNFFSINIFNFLDANEVLLKTLYSLPYVIPMIIIFPILYYKRWIGEWKWKIMASLQRFEKVMLSNLIVGFGILGFVLLGCYFQREKIKEYDIFMPALLHYFFLFSFITIIFILYLFLRKTHANEGFGSALLSTNASKTLSVISGLTILICLPSLTETIRAQKNILFENAEITVGTQTIKCSQKKFCVGITRNFVFLYDVENKTPVIYNMSQVTSLKTGYELNGK